MKRYILREKHIHSLSSAYNVSATKSCDNFAVYNMVKRIARTMDEDIQ